MLFKPFAKASWCLAACAAVGCGSSHPGSATGAAVRTFTGAVDSSDAQMAIVTAGAQARVYFCGGNATYPTLTHWLNGVAVDPAHGTLAQSGAAGDWSVDGQLSDAGAAGAATSADGTKLTFRATPVGAGTIAGLYEANAPCGKVGLIVTQSSPQAAPSGQGACIGGSATHPVEQVNPIMPIARAADGTIGVRIAGDTADLRLSPAVLATN